MRTATPNTLRIAAASVAAIVGAMTLAPVDASAGWRKDRNQTGTYVKSLFSADKEVDCSISRGHSRFCLSAPRIHRKPRVRIKVINGKRYRIYRRR